MRAMTVRLGIAAAAIALVLVGGALVSNVQAAPAAQGTATPIPTLVPPGTPPTVVPPPPTTTPPQVATTDIGVSGTGRVFTSPDTAIATVGVEIMAPTLEAATRDASERMTRVLDAIKAAGVDAKDITTVSYSVNPVTNNPREGENLQVTGYRVTNLVQVKVRQIDNVGKVLDGAIAAGANNLGGVYFTVEDPTNLETEARTQAVKAAMAKAQTLAEAAGVRLGRIISITETVQARPLARQAMLAAPAPAVDSIGPVQTGEFEVSVTVEMHFEIAQ